MSQPIDSNINSEISDGLLWVTIDREAQHNALSLKMLSALGSLFREHAVDEQIRLAVITGAGTESFAAGGDLKELDAVRSVADTQAMSQTGMTALNAIREFPVPVVAALNGAARGGGAELTLACDIRIAAEHAKLGLIQGRLNLSTAWGGGSDLFALVGHSKGLLLLGRADLLTADEAREMGLVDHVLPSAKGSIPNSASFNAAVREFLQPMLARPPQVLRAHKALARRYSANLQAQQRQESRLLVGTWTHDDHWQAAAGAFDQPR